MAYRKLALTLFAIILAVTATPIAYGVLYKGVDVVGFRVRGRAVCSLLANPPCTAPGIAGVNVEITCNGASKSLAQVVTDPNGSFDIVAESLDGTTFEQTTLPCVATIHLANVANCSVFPPKATIRAAISLVGTVSKLLTGFVANTVSGVFVLVNN